MDRVQVDPIAGVKEDSKIRGILRTLLTVLFVLGVVAWAYSSILPPESKPATANLAEFSAERAMQHLRIIARAPHPMGSQENAKVRAYLIDQLAALGFHAEVQNTAVSHRYDNQFFAGNVSNIVARLGKPGDPAVLIMAHYDSVPTGPGANDNGTGVAAILEALRALKYRGYPQHDLVVLFSDGEEAGLLGAYGFIEGHVWAKDIAVAVNFEARGRYGPSLLFETGPGNQDVVRAISRRGADLVGDSVMNAIYRLQPYQTDLTALNAKGVPSLNFAYIGDATVYHRMADDIASVSGSSLQHHGQHALDALLSLSPKEVLSKDNVVYFNGLSRTMWTVPVSYVLPISVLALVLTAAGLYFGSRRQQLHVRGVITILGAGIALAIVGSGLAFLSFVYLQGCISHVEHLGWSTLGFAVIVGATIWMSSALLGFWKGPSVQDIRFSIPSLLLVLALAVALISAEAAHIFLLPGLSGLLGWFILSLGPRSESRSPWAELLACLLQIPAMLVVFRLAIAVFWLTGGLRPVAMVFAIFLALASCVIPLSMIRRNDHQWLGRLALISAVALSLILAIGLHLPRFTSALPIQSLIYFVDTDKQVAFLVGDREWAGDVAEPLGLTKEATSSLEDWGLGAENLRLRAYRAPLVRSDVSKIKVRYRQSNLDSVEFAVTINPAPLASRVTVYFDAVIPDSIQLEGAVQGISRARGSDPAVLHVNAPNGAAIMLSFRSDSKMPAILKVVDEFPGIPDLPGVYGKSIMEGQNPYYLVSPFHTNTSVVKHESRL